MTRAQAERRTKVAYGDKAILSYRPDGSTAAERAVASEALKAHRAMKPAEPTVPRTAESPEWAVYRRARIVWKEREGELIYAAVSHRYSVGYLGHYGLAFVVQGRGDTWAEACAKLPTKRVSVL